MSFPLTKINPVGPTVQTCDVYVIPILKPSHNVICHCKTNTVKIRDRHNSIVECLSIVVRIGNIRIDQQVSGVQNECRPDIVIHDGQEVAIINMTCTFKNSEDMLVNADFNKVTKYNHLKQHFNY